MSAPLSMAWRAWLVHSIHGFSMSYAIAAWAAWMHTKRTRRRSAVVRGDDMLISLVGWEGKEGRRRRAERLPRRKCDRRPGIRLGGAHRVLRRRKGRPAVRRLEKSRTGMSISPALRRP